MSQNIQEVLSNFSRKLSRFNQSSSTERTKSPSKDAYYEEKLRERGERFKLSVVSNYKIYKSPFQTLGQNSDRAASLDKDQQNLLKAYNLYKSCMEIDKENQDEIGQTYVKSVEIASPLSDKASYTSGGQFIYLMAWLYFEQNCQDYIPFFSEKENHFSLEFAKIASFQFDSHDQEIFDIIKAEFYS
ncbi:MAG: hypothetical protein K5873_01425 [Treponema sp.]|nr:hypothetical protein [Treponema sp.]